MNRMVNGLRRPHFIIAIAILFALQVTEGIDQAVLSFTAPFLRKALGIGFESLGAAFSAGYIGTALGAVLFGTLADSTGRKIACTSRRFRFRLDVSARYSFAKVPS